MTKKWFGVKNRTQIHAESEKELSGRVAPVPAKETRIPAERAQAFLVDQPEVSQEARAAS